VIHFDEEAADFIVQADEDKIRIVLLNLLENAAKYGVRDTAIICKVEKPATVEALTVRFINTTKEERVETGNLQVAFFRSDLVQKGAGLGLWLCNEIIRLHRGRIGVFSGEHRFEVTMNLPLTDVVVEGRAIA
jgi:signal transduction histidine kinase